MGDRSEIQWTDATWNPVTGCSKVSPGCAHCYAETLTARYAGRPGYIAEHRPWTPANAAHNVVRRPERLEQPLRWTKPRMVFVNSMSDLFHEEVPDEFIAEVFARMLVAPQHTFQVLTKRPERMRDLLRDPDPSTYSDFWQAVGDAAERLGLPGDLNVDAHIDHSGTWLGNVWLGVSIENRRYVHRADLLRGTPAAVRFISAEPLLGPLLPSPANARARGWPSGQAWPDDYEGHGLRLEGIDWLIVGGESGPGHRLMVDDWVRDLRDACAATGRQFGSHSHRTAFFFKQWGGATPKSGGRELDGRTWDEMPRTVEEGRRPAINPGIPSGDPPERSGVPA
jgi:protein gp37